MKAKMSVLLLAVALLPLVLFAQILPPAPSNNGGGGSGLPITTWPPTTGTSSTMKELPMIATRALLKSYAIDRVSSAAISIYSGAMVWSPGLTNYAEVFTRQYFGNLVSISQAVASKDLQFKLASSNATVNVSLYYMDTNGAPQLEGHASGKPEKNALGQWTLSPSARYLEVDLSPNIDIYIPNVTGAEVLFPNPQGSGETIRRRLDVNQSDSLVRFPSDLASANAILLVESQRDGIFVTDLYDIHSGKAVLPIEGHSRFSVVLRDFVAFGPGTPNPNNLNIVIVLESQRGHGESPLIQVNVGNPVVPNTMRLKATTTEGEKATGMWFRAANGGQLQFTKFLPGAEGEIILPFDLPGTFYIILDWPSLRSWREEIPVQPDLPNPGKG